MFVYKLTMNKVEEPKHAVVSSYVSPRIPVKVEFYKTKELADAKQKQYYDALFSLLGIQHSHEIIITEINVIEEI